MVLGLTGPTGAGKSTVSEILKNQPDCVVIDADTVARQVVSSGTDCLAEIALNFSTGVLHRDGTLNRRMLGEMVFSDKEQLRKLNRIIFPYISAEINKMIARESEDGKKLIVLDAPTLFESKTDGLCDKIAVVTADMALRRKRIMKRDDLPKELADSRISSQHPEHYYTSKADFVIRNNDQMPSLRVQVMELLGSLGL